MDEEIMRQIFDELLSSLEPLETQCAALMQLVKDKGIATDDELAPYLEQAGNAAEIRGRAARLRMSSLILSAMKPAAATEQADAGAAQAAPEKAGGADPVAVESAESSSTESEDQSSQPEPSDAQPSNTKPPNARPSSAGDEGGVANPPPRGARKRPPEKKKSHRKPTAVACDGRRRGLLCRPVTIDSSKLRSAALFFRARNIEGTDPV